MTRYLPYNQMVDDCLSDNIGGNGLYMQHFENLLKILTAAHDKLRFDYKSGALPLLKLPEAREDLEILKPIAQYYREEFDDVVILGTGGSSLGGKALYEMARPKSTKLNKGSKTVDSSPNLHIVTNIDPFSFSALFDNLDYEKTGFIVISKSGATVETVMHFLSILPNLKQTIREDQLKSCVTFITEPGNNPLRRIGEKYKIPILDHDPKIGGRYSVLSLVGMLPAMIGGLDAIETRQGAMSILSNTLEVTKPLNSPPSVGAAISIGLNQHNDITNTVMLSYSDRLGSLARWYRQLWAESLGKQGKGTTPIYGTGPVDQHSQLQLWLAGPDDKIFTILGGPLSQGSLPIAPELCDDPELSYMRDRTMGDLMEASRIATAKTLVAAGKPVRHITVNEINAHSMGALMMHFMLETIFSASLLGVDPYDQPAVEHGKILTRQYMAKMSNDKNITNDNLSIKS